VTEPGRSPSAEDLYHAALERAPGERANFLDEACRGDAELRREVESLLGYAEQAKRLLDEPVAGAVTQALGVTPGTRLGPYEVTERIGAGGMGEVFRARDTKLGRDVALKLLPDALSQDRERLARFEREARVLASLNHPGIATLYGLEEHEGRPLLVMELVEGETLGARLERGPLERAEALDVFAQMAEALEAAHERGIIHRDLKPANVQRTPAGRVKLLDFGLAKTLAGGAGPESPDASGAATRTGMVLGTAAYMSPEQARGQELDARTDLWSFGCVMYEVLSGRRVFRAATVTETLAAVLRSEVEWEALPAGTPEALRRLLRRCLEREPSRRLRHAADARLEIEDARAELDAARAGAATGDRSAPSHRPAPSPRWLVPVLGIAVAASAALASWAVWTLAQREPPAARVTRFTIDIEREVEPGAQLLAAQGQTPIAMAPDGSRLAYVAQNARREPALYLRELQGFSSRLLAVGALPSFSPDGLSVAFVGAGLNSVWSVSVKGGAPVELAQAPGRLQGVFWAGDRLLLNVPSGVFELPARGGEPREMDGLAGRVARQFLPETGELLVTPPFGLASPASGADIVSLGGEPRRHLFPANSRQRYGVRLLPTGHLVWLDGNTLRAVRVAEDDGRPEEDPSPLLEGVLTFAVSESGTLVYAMEPPPPEAELAWVDLDGRATPIPGARGDAEAYPPRLSPDGRLAALSSADGDIWVLDLERGTRRRLTFEGFNYSPVWSPDGAWIAFQSTRNGARGLFRVRADGSARASLVVDGNLVPWDWSPDGGTIASVDFGAQEIVMVTPEGDTETLEVGPGRKGLGVSFSPNGRWLALTWEQGDRQEVYVRPFPGPGAATLVSDSGGEIPSWSPRGDELYYLEGPVAEAVDGSLRRWKAVTLNLDVDPIRVGRPRFLFDGLYHGGDVSPDGGRFLMRHNDPTSTVTELRVVLNWTTELEREVP